MPQINSAQNLPRKIDFLSGKWPENKIDTEQKTYWQKSLHLEDRFNMFKNNSVKLVGQKTSFMLSQITFGNLSQRASKAMEIR